MESNLTGRITVGTVGSGTIHRSQYIHHACLRYESRYDNGTKYRIPEGGMHKVTGSTTSQITWKLQGEWSQSFADIHEVQIMGGSEYEKLV